MTELDVIGALQNKRTELTGTLRQLEQQLAQHRINLAHLDATMRLFDTDTQPNALPSQPPAAPQCLVSPGRVHPVDLRRVARGPQRPITTRELAERLMCIKGLPAGDSQSRASVQQTLLGSLNRAKQTIARVEIGGVVSWRLI